MRRLITLALVFGASAFAFAQTSSSQWQKGTISAVTTHVYAPGKHASDAGQYDVTLQVGNTNYVVLYTLPNGANTVEYLRGVDLLAQVGAADTLTFNTRSQEEQQKCPSCKRKYFPREASPICPRCRVNTTALRYSIFPKP